MLNKEDIRKKVETEEDFIYCPRLNNSLEKFLIAHPDGIDNAKIAKVLMMTEEEVEAAFQSALKKLKESLEKGKDNG